MTIFLLCVIIVLCALLIISNKKIDALKIELKNQNVEYEKNLQIIERDLNTAKSIRHDYKNHLITLSGLIEQGEKEDALSYIKNIIKQKGKENKISSGNAVVDSILNAKYADMQKHNVNFILDANLPLRLNIQAPSLTTILSNLLDNAIYAAQKCENSYVDLKLKYTKSNFIIMIKNPYEDEIIKKSNKFHTTKKDKKNHGFGIESVRLTVKRLRGTCEIEHSDNVFNVCIIIPL